MEYPKKPVKKTKPKKAQYNEAGERVCPHCNTIMKISSGKTRPGKIFCPTCYKKYECNRNAFCIEVKKYWVHTQGGKCCKCAYNESYNALEFHHINEREKSFEVNGRNFFSKTREQLEAEIEKCILLCSNCHTVIHDSAIITESVEELFELKNRSMAGTKIGFKQTVIFWYKNIVERISLFMNMVATKVVTV